VGLFPRRVHGVVAYAPLALDFIRSRRAGQLGIADEPGRAVARHVEFRDHADAAVARIRDQLTDFALGVVETVRTQFVELRKSLAFYPEALVFRQMPVKYVELYCGHAVQVPLKDVERDKVAADVNHQSAPGK